MSAIRVQMSLVLGLSFLLAGRATADELENFRKQNELQAQKLIGDVKDALAQSRVLERSDASKARDVLRKVLGKLEDDLVLPERQRLQLIEQVRIRLRAVIQSARAREADDELAAEREARRQRERERDREQPRPSGDRPFPTQGPSSVAKDYLKNAKDRLNTVDRIKGNRTRGTSDVMRDLDDSAARLNEQRITERFIKATQARQQKLTAKEQTLLKALNSSMSADFERTPFNEVINYIQEKTGQTILIDDPSMREAMVESEDPVSFKHKKIQVRTLLRKILADRGLTYVIREGSIQVVTPQKARDMMVVRSYPVADLVFPVQDFGIWNDLMALQNVQSLINIIQQSVDPTIWQQGGSINFVPAARALVIRAPAEIHYQLGSGMSGGR